MASTSFNAVRKSIIKQLKQAYPEMKVHGEGIAQHFQAPCFFVEMFPTAESKVLGNRYKRYHAFDIHYFSNEHDKNDDCHEMAEQLYNQLENITVNDDILMGTKMEHRIAEGVLHFIVHFDTFVYKAVEKAPFMEVLKTGRGDRT
ncbi:hypothetical protein A0U40_18270 [[Bacillus] sp. KCTC 13219]|nr:hypothetical protein A0U40_18270 [[Bacillus] sp. KCTC 13219]